MEDITVLKARLWYAQNALDCIDEAVTGKVKVEDIKKVVKYNIERCHSVLAGSFDHTLAFKQKVHYIENGESVAILGL